MRKIIIYIYTRDKHTILYYCFKVVMSIRRVHMRLDILETLFFTIFDL